MSPAGRRSPLALTALVLGLLGATGCGGGSQADGAGSSTTSAGSSIPTAAASPSAACDAAQSPVAPDRIDVTVDGTPRTASVHVPATAERDSSTEPLPVVLSFHGVNGTPAVQQAADGLLALSDDEGVVVVHPEGLVVGLNDRVPDLTGWDADGDRVDEPGFVAAALDELGDQVCIDTGRVFATGFSAGGNIALVVSCALPDRIAAVAPVGAAYQPGQCRDAPPLPVLAFHGRDDVVVPFDGRDTARAGTLVPVRDALEAQARRNGCAGDVTTTELSPRVRAFDWSGCDVSTTLVELDDHGHAWPGHPMPFGRDALVALFAGSGERPPDPLMVAIGEQPDTMADNVLLTNDDVDATAMIWEFFSGVR